MSIDWLAVHWIFLKTHLISLGKVYLLAGDEVVEAKAGKKTYGVGRFYSGLAQGVIPNSRPKPKPTSRYGDKLNYQHLPLSAKVASRSEGHYQIETYQLQLYHKDYSNLLNVVIVVKTHLLTGKRGHIILFATDLTLTAEQIVDYYSLRFQIEFNFRDTKQYWGLGDFLTVKPQAVTKSINLAFFMVNCSQVILKPYREHDSDFSVLDLKAQFRAQRYLFETIKLLPETPTPDLISRIWR